MIINFSRPNISFPLVTDEEITGAFVQTRFSSNVFKNISLKKLKSKDSVTIKKKITENSTTFEA